MRKQDLLRVALPFLAAGILLTAASPAWACEGSSCSGFTQDEYEAIEGQGYAELQVSAAWCCPTAQGTIDYETSDLNAIAGQDYQQTSGTLTFTGHGDASIRVAIYFDDLTEGEERFEVRLTNFRGTFVSRGRETAVVKIVDDYARRFSSDPVQLGRSDQQAAGSQSGPSRSRSTSTGPASLGDSDSPSAPVNPADPIPTTGVEDSGDDAQRAAAQASEENNASSVGGAGLRALLVVMIAAAAGIGLKMKFGGG